MLSFQLVRNGAAIQVLCDDQGIDALVDTGDLHFFDPETGLGIYGSDEKRDADNERVGDGGSTAVARVN